MKTRPSTTNTEIDQPPVRAILVTGAHRTGTSWVGKMLAASGQAAYISEPLNIYHRPGVMRIPTRHWYTYICSENEREYLAGLLETQALKYHLGAEIKSLRSRKDFLRMLRDASIFTRGRLLSQRALFKDPFAIFSAPWFASRLGFQVVITIRHPAAFASSLKRLKWHFDFRHLLDQPLLMRDHLSPWRAEIEAAASGDIITQASLLWTIIYQTVNKFMEQNTNFKLVYHEQLSLAPLDGFKELYTSLGLVFSQTAKNSILKSSQASNPTEISKDAVHATKLNSKANLENWKRRLSPDEIQRIHRLTRDTAALFYPEATWN